MKFTLLFVTFFLSVYGNPLGTPLEDIYVPYIVSITDGMMYTQHTASGSILNNRYIVSNGRPFSSAWSSPSHFMAVANIARTWDWSPDSYRIESYVIHPYFDSETGENDIAVLRTTTSIEFHERVQPIPLSVYLINNQDALFAGFGFAEDNPTVNVPLTTVEFRSISNEECQNILGEEAGRVFDSKACVVPIVDRLICNYDNGAPLTIGNRLVGISSWSIRCERNAPIVVERISAHSDFILQNS